MSHEEDVQRFAKKLFYIILAGTIAYGAVVVFFIL